MSEKLDLKKETAKATRCFCFTHSSWVQKGKGRCREVGEKAVRQTNACWGMLGCLRLPGVWQAAPELHSTGTTCCSIRQAAGWLKGKDEGRKNGWGMSHTLLRLGAGRDQVCNGVDWSECSFNIQ